MAKKTVGDFMGKTATKRKTVARRKTATTKRKYPRRTVNTAPTDFIDGIVGNRTPRQAFLEGMRHGEIYGYLQGSN